MRLFPLLLLFGLSFPATAEEPAPLPSSACPALFGDEAARAENRELRKERLVGVRRGEHVVEILHSDSGWRAPEQKRLPGIEVLFVGAEGAVVLVKERWAEVCTPGRYWLGVDDALGTEARVLALLDGALLVERAGRLLVIPAREQAVAALPVRMIWRSAYGIRVASADIGSGSGSKSAAWAGRPGKFEQGKSARPAARALAEERKRSQAIRKKRHFATGK